MFIELTIRVVLCRDVVRQSHREALSVFSHVEPGRGIRARRTARVPGIRHESRIEVPLAEIFGSCGKLYRPLRRDDATLARPEILFDLLGGGDHL